MPKPSDGRAALIRTEMDKDIIGGDVFILLNKARTMINVLPMKSKTSAYFTGD